MCRNTVLTVFVFRLLPGLIGHQHKQLADIPINTIQAIGIQDL